MLLDKSCWRYAFIILASLSLGATSLAAAAQHHTDQGQIEHNKAAQEIKGPEPSAVIHRDSAPPSQNGDNKCVDEQKKEKPCDVIAANAAVDQAKYARREMWIDAGSLGIGFFGLVAATLAALWAKGAVTQAQRSANASAKSIELETRQFAVLNRPRLSIRLIYLGENIAPNKMLKLNVMLYNSGGSRASVGKVALDFIVRPDNNDQFVSEIDLGSNYHIELGDHDERQYELNRVLTLDEFDQIMNGFAELWVKGTIIYYDDPVDPENPLRRLKMTTGIFRKLDTRDGNFKRPKPNHIDCQHDYEG
jgi:hypothetical protein